jgi:arabinofuranosyltransferase
VYVLGAFVVSALGCAAGVVGFGGDYIHGRLLLPAFFALCAPAAVIPLTKRYAMLFVVVAWAAVCGVALRPRELKHVYNVRQGILYSLPITNCCGDISLDSLGWGPRSPHRVAFDGGGVFVSETTNKRQFGFVYTEVTTPLKPDIHLPTIASGGIGILSYALGPRVSVLDLNGLADTTAAHLALVRRGYPGHEKALPGPWVAAMLTADGTQPIPDEFQIASEPTTPPDPNLPFEQQVTLARQALQCGALRDLQRSTEKHLTIGLFMSNVLHARSRTALRIPSNPRDAEVRFCGDTSRHVAARSVLASTVARATVTDCRSRPYCRANDQRTSRRSASVVLPARTRVADIARGPP